MTGRIGMLLLTLALLAPGDLRAQAKRKTPATASARSIPQPVPSPAPETFEVDLSTRKVPPTLGRGDLSGLLQALVPRPKGEFESTADYQARTGSAESGKAYAIAIDADNSNCGMHF